jgi:hypothetical protein
MFVQQLWLRLLILVTVILAGCATPAPQKAVSLGVAETPAKPNPALIGNISIRNVSGGQDTNAYWISKIDNERFRSELEQSMNAIGYLAPKGFAGKYQLDVTLQYLDKPSYGDTLNFRSSVFYTLNGENGKKITFPVTAVGTATTSDTFLVGRERNADYRSIKENINLFLINLSEQIIR